MPRNRKVGSKIYFMVGLLLAMAVVIGGEGYHALNSLTSRMQKESAVQDITEAVATTRTAEKDFVLQRSTEGKAALHARLEELRQATRAAKELFTDQLNQDQMDQILTKVDAYEQTAGAYGDCDQSRRDSMESMRASSRTLLAQLTAIKQSQVEQVNAAQQASRDDGLRSRRLGDLAADMRYRFVEVRKNEKEMILSKGADASWVTLVQDGVTAVAGLGQQLRTAAATDEDRARADRLATELADYQREFGQLLGAVQQQQDLTALMQQIRKESEQVLTQLDAIATAQQGQLVTIVEAGDKAVGRAVQRLVLAAAMEATVLDVRKDEKEYILSREASFKAAVAGGIQQVRAAIQQLGALVEKAETRTALASIEACVSQYETDFARYDALLQQQGESLAAMAAKAGEVVAVCDAADTDQADKLKAETTMAVALLLGVCGSEPERESQRQPFRIG